MAFWLKMVVFWLRLTTFVTQALAGRFKLRWFDDVCNVGRPSVAHSGLATTYGRRSLVLSTRWPGGLKPLSPLRVRNGRFSAVFGRRGDDSFSGPLLWVCRGDAGFNVAMLSRLVRDILRAARSGVGASAKKFALRHCGHRVSAKKFAPHTKNGPEWVFYAALGELLRG